MTFSALFTLILCVFKDVAPIAKSNKKKVTDRDRLFSLTGEKGS